MNHSRRRIFNAAEKEGRRSSPTLTLVAGLVLGFPGGAAALAPAVGLALAFSGTAALAAQVVSTALGARAIPSVMRGM